MKLRIAHTVALGALALVVTACPPTTPAGPVDDPGPLLDGVIAIAPGGTGYSAQPMSADGRWVAYTRDAGAGNGGVDSYLWDNTASISYRLTTPEFNVPSETTAPAVSADGSTVWLGYHRLDGAFQGPEYGPTLVRIDTSDGTLEQFEQPKSEPFAGESIQAQVTSADGSVVAMALGWRFGHPARHVALFTEDTGFEMITDPTLAGVYRYRLPGAAISQNGRYVAVVADLQPGPDLHRARLDLYDRTTRTWRTAVLGEIDSTADALTDDTITVLAVLDDGSMLLDVTSPRFLGEHPVAKGVARWNASTGAVTPALDDPGARGFSASPDGRYIGYTASDLGPPAQPSSNGTPYIVDTTTGITVQAGGRPFTRPIALGADADPVLLWSDDPTVVGANPPGAEGNQLFLWHRT